MAFNSCSYFNNQESPEYMESAHFVPNNVYGNYLAGRIAHYRQDFDSAADYYMKTAQKDTSNKELLNKTYLMLASQGRLEEAAKYAEISKKQNDSNELADMILVIEKFKQGHYQESIDAISKIKAPLYKKIITPFIVAWANVGLNQYDKAIHSLDNIKKEKGMEAVYHFHAGMINDYFNKIDEAQKHYENIIQDSEMELSVRTLEVICNFYIRNNQQEKAAALAQKFAGSLPSINMLQKIYKDVKNAKPSATKAIINSPQAGLSEALFNIAAIIKHNAEAIDFSHIFIRMAIYENPDNQLARILLANILEMREMYSDAIAVYDEIPVQSTAYYIAQYKKAENLRNMNDYKASELLLKSLILDYPDDYQILIDLGDTLRLQEKYKEALKYYHAVLEKHKVLAGDMWQIYYALGITYERLGDWANAEKMLQKALEVTPDNMLVLNYLGYSWLTQNKNQEQAFEYIVNAYIQMPYNSSITDSLGWAFYRLGKYDEAIYYLEKATEAEPSNALINEHLGDAYWQGGRKNEARFQWNHALTLKDDTGEVKKDVLKQKINDGMTENKILTIDEKKFDEIVAKLPEKSK